MYSLVVLNKKPFATNVSMCVLQIIKLLLFPVMLLQLVALAGSLTGGQEIPAYTVLVSR